MTSLLECSHIGISIVLGCKIFKHAEKWNTTQIVANMHSAITAWTCGLMKRKPMQ